MRKVNILLVIFFLELAACLFMLTHWPSVAHRYSTSRAVKSKLVHPDDSKLIERNEMFLADMLLNAKTENLTKPDTFSAPPFPLQDVDPKFGSEFWRELFPDLKDLLDNIDNGSMKWPVPLPDTTDPKSTTFHLEKTTYHVGEEIRGYLQTRNFRGEPKTYGGDHFRARLIRLDKHGNATADSVPCIVSYEQEGVYELRTVVPWIGKCIFDITLIHPSEAVVDLVERTATLTNQVFGPRCKFETGPAQDCDVKLMNYTGPVCDFSNRAKGITWFCTNPDNLTCPDDVTNLPRRTLSSFALGSHPLFTSEVNWKVPIKDSASNVVTSEIGETLKAVELPKCEPGNNNESRNLPTGFYQGNAWHSLLCKNSVKDLSGAKRCLKGTSVHFLGDSTMRQWFVSGLVKALDLRDVHSPLTRRFWSMPRFGVDARGVPRLFYKGHGNRFNNPGPPESHPSIVASLAGIGAGGAAVVLNVGAHFLEYDPVYLLQRANAIKAAVVALKRRRPDAAVFLRGNIRFDGTWPGIVSEWYYLRADRVLRRVFRDLPYVTVIDTWDMTTCRAQASVHADTQTVVDFVALFLSHLC